MTNTWKFFRLNQNECAVRDRSGTTYFTANGDLAAHACQDFMRWTAPPELPGHKGNPAFGLKQVTEPDGGR